MAKGYIERDVALKLIKEEGINQAEQYADRHHPVVLAYGDCFGKIKSLPTADVVEVVRCEKCKCCVTHTCVITGIKTLFCVYGEKPAMVHPTHFCSYGEKR